MRSGQLRCRYVSPQDEALEEVSQLLQSILGVLLGRDAEDLVELFEAEAFGFRNKEQHSEEADEIPDSIVRKGTLRLECLE